jgi:hypothetical protein
MRQILFKIALLISLNSFVGCAVEHSFTVTPVNVMPKGKTKAVRKYSTTLIAGAKHTRNVVEVYDIGATVDADGDLVGKHQLFRVVESSRWVLASKVKSPPFPVATPDHQERVPKKERVENNAKAVPQASPGSTDLNNALAGQQPQQDGTSVIPDDITKASPAEQQALQDFSNVKPAATP